MSFEEAQERIEEIIEGLEEGNLPLKESIAKFKEAAELLKFCNKEIKDVEMDIQKILDKDGKISFEKFD
jgi:exodeoxyribonuclease VII small subunit